MNCKRLIHVIIRSFETWKSPFAENDKNLVLIKIVKFIWHKACYFSYRYCTYYICMRWARSVPALRYSRVAHVFISSSSPNPLLLLKFPSLYNYLVLNKCVQHERLIFVKWEIFLMMEWVLRYSLTSTDLNKDLFENFIFLQ